MTTDTHRKVPLTRDHASTLAANHRCAEAKFGRTLSHSQALARVAEMAGYANVHEMTAQYDAASRGAVGARSGHALLRAMIPGADDSVRLLNLLTDLVIERGMAPLGVGPAKDRTAPSIAFTLRVGPDVPNGMEIVTGDSGDDLPAKSGIAAEMAARTDVPIVSFGLNRSAAPSDVKGLPLPASRRATRAEWLDFARDSKAIHADVVAFVEANPDAVDLANSPSFMSYEQLSAYLFATDVTPLPAKSMQITIEGLLGEDLAARFTAFRKRRLGNRWEAGVVDPGLVARWTVNFHDGMFGSLSLENQESIARNIHANSRANHRGIGVGPGLSILSWSDLRLWVASTFHHFGRKPRYALSQHIDARIGELRASLTEDDDAQDAALLGMLKGFGDAPDGLIKEMADATPDAIPDGVNEPLRVALFTDLQSLVPEDDEG